MPSPNQFSSDFDSALEDAENLFGESWEFNNNTYPAIAIDTMKVGSSVMKGGKFIDVSTSIHIRKSVLASSGVTDSSTVSARGQTLDVINIESDLIDSAILICGPSQIDIGFR